ncbi:hypothetical protein J6590_098051 [Homalodisca vitripennis]|nr:hypothetical protein J6590_098051 [Homalodisca vitripennis]
MDLFFFEATSDSPGQYFCHCPQPHPCCSLLSTSSVLIVVDIALLLLSMDLFCEATSDSPGQYFCHCPQPHPCCSLLSNRAVLIVVDISLLLLSMDLFCEATTDSPGQYFCHCPQPHPCCSLLRTRAELILVDISLLLLSVDLFCEATSDSPGQYFVTVHNHILAVHCSVGALYIRQPRAVLCHCPQPHPCCSLLSTSSVLIVVDIALLLLSVDLFCEATSDSPGQYFVTVHNHTLAVHCSVPALCSL